MSIRALIPAITTAQMIEVDRLMIAEYGIRLVQMMENAGRNLAELAVRLLDDQPGDQSGFQLGGQSGGEASSRRIAVLCGGGNNGGGGMAAARHLHNRGAEVGLVVAAAPERIKAEPANHLRTLAKMGIFPQETLDLDAFDLIIDALIGYGVSGDPRGAVADWIRRANAARPPVLALDAPSGLDLTTGKPGNPCIRADATLTLALPKTGLLTVQAKPYTGRLYLADIGVPPELYAAQSLGIEIPALFVHDTILSIEDWSL